MTGIIGIYPVKALARNIGIFQLEGLAKIIGDFSTEGLAKINEAFSTEGWQGIIRIFSAKELTRNIGIFQNGRTGKYYNSAEGLADTFDTFPAKALAGNLDFSDETLSGIFETYSFLCGRQHIRIIFTRHNTKKFQFFFTVRKNRFSSICL